jgi:hypothetical protein
MTDSGDNRTYPSLVGETIICIYGFFASGTEEASGDGDAMAFENPNVRGVFLTGSSGV